MRLLEESYGDVRIFSERPFGYKRYIVERSKIQPKSTLDYGIL